MKTCMFQNGKSSSTKTPEKKVIKIEKPMLYSCQFCGFSSAFKCGWAQHQKKHSAQLEKGGKAAYPTQTHKNTKGDDQQTKRSIRKVLLKLYDIFFIPFSYIQTFRLILPRILVVMVILTAAVNRVR